MDLHVKLPGLHLKSPTIPTSGYFGLGREFAELYNLSLLGSMVIKSTTPHNRSENPTPRIVGTPCDVLNAISLQDPGVDVVMERGLPWLAQFNTGIIANVAGTSEEKYVEVVTKLNESKVVKAYELSISHPNVKHEGIGLGTDPKLAANVTHMIKETAEKPIYVKLSPSVTNIVEITKAVEEVEVDGLVLINTLMGMHMDLYTRKPLLANVTGGLSDPAIKPVVVCIVHQVASAVNIPIIDVGGIARAEGVLEFLYARTSTVEVGMQSFVDPLCCVKITEDSPEVLRKYGNNNLSDAVGRSFR